MLPDPLPERFLFISAGSGITPIMSMLRALARRDALADVVLLHSARTPDDVIFGAELRELARRHPGFRLHEQLTATMGRMGPGDLDALCPDWREREAFISGPAEMLDALSEHWEREGDSRRLHMERFQPIIGSEDAEHGEGGTIRVHQQRHRGHRATAAKPILVAGEEAGATLPFGCRMGICHTCVGQLCSGQVRDLRTGKVSGASGEIDPHLRERPRRPSRDRPLNRPQEDPMATMIESPLARLTPEQIEELGKEFDAIHDEVFAELGDRDRRYITSMIEMHRQARRAQPHAAARPRATGPPGSPAPRCSRWPRSWRTWRSATT